MKIYTSGSKKNIYSPIAGSKYFHKFCQSLGMTFQERVIVEVLLNNQDEYITHNKEIEEYTGLTNKQIEGAIKKLKTRPYIKIITVREGMNTVRHTDLWEFCKKFDEFVENINNQVENNENTSALDLAQAPADDCAEVYFDFLDKEETVHPFKSTVSEEEFRNSEEEIESLLMMI